MSTATKITATVGLVLIVVALLLGIVGVATNSWAEARTEFEVRTEAFTATARYGLWQVCVKSSV